MATTLRKLTSAVHKGQIDAYVKELPRYEVYTNVLQRVLQSACRASFPEAMVQTRAKSVSSFAEKVARKWDEEHTNPVRQFTDLCGARVIVQTTDQVEGVCKFIEANFVIVEADNKEVRLGADRFGYRDMHYVVQLRPDRDLGITPLERDEIGRRKAEIQVRTWVQHAWADTLHDRLYKAKVKASPDMVRTGNLLAALMEEGDRVFCRLAGDIDGIIANYSAHASKQDVEKQIEIQRLILANERDDAKKPGLSLGLARLLAATGDHAAIVEALKPHLKTRGPIRCELLLQLGQSLCAAHRSQPDGAAYGLGRRCLREARDLCAAKAVTFAPNLRTRDGLHARVLSSLGWALEVVPADRGEARECFRRAYEHEPGNPYHLANMLGCELRFSHSASLPGSMRPALRAGIRTCLAHAAAGIELPQSAFTAGRLALLLDDLIVPDRVDEPGSAQRALGYYARGIHHVLAGTHCAPADSIDRELEWLIRLHEGEAVPATHQPAIELLALAELVRQGKQPSAAKAKIKGPVVIVAGGARRIDAKVLAKARPLLAEALAEFDGTVIAGGTQQGIPGCVGDVAVNLRKRGQKRFRLIAYRPSTLPDDAGHHPGYDEPVRIGDKFSAQQLVQTWSDILAGGTKPQEVMLLGFGGGPLSALDYRLALGLGARVGVVVGTGESASAILGKPIWSQLPNLLPLPMDAATLRAFVLPPQAGKVSVEQSAEEIHRRYLKSKTRDLPVNMQPWAKLDDTFKRSSRQQAIYAVRILEATGFHVRKVAGKPAIFRSFKPAEIEHMAELEHGRWNVERLADGWRLGPRDDKSRRHPRLVSWQELPEPIRDFDRKAVRAFPEVLAVQGLEVRRKGK